MLATTATKKLCLTSWEDIETATTSDQEYSDLLHSTQNPDHDWPETIQEHEKFRNEFPTVDGVVLYRGRVFIPKVLRHRVSTSYNPHANLRSETAVKTMKRPIMTNTGPDGSINNDAIAAALLTYRNTPDRDTARSPAQILYGRQLSDALPCDPSKLRVRPEWILTAGMREKALAKRHLATKTNLLNKCMPLKPLKVHTVIQVQNQRGAHANKQDLPGTVIETQPFDSYLVKMDGTGRVTKRHGRFLRPIIPFSDGNLSKLPLQQYNQPLVREAPAATAVHDDNDLGNKLINSGPSADKARRPSTLPQSNSQPAATAVHDDNDLGNKLINSGPSADKAGRPSTLPQSNSQSAAAESTSVLATDNDSKSCPLKANENVHQYKDSPLHNSRPKRVRISTKRYISES